MNAYLFLYNTAMVAGWAFVLRFRVGTGALEASPHQCSNIFWSTSFLAGGGRGFDGAARSAKLNLS